MNCPHCESKLLWSEDRGAHCDGCDEFEELRLCVDHSSGTSNHENSYPMKLAVLIMWLLPWGLISIGLALAGRPMASFLLGALSLLGVVGVLSMARAAKGN